jgi:hypothetical protein
MEDGLIKENLTINGVTGTTYYEEIKPKLSEKALKEIREGNERNTRKHKKTK